MWTLCPLRCRLSSALGKCAGGVVLVVVAYRVRGVSETSSSPNVLHL